MEFELDRAYGMHERNVCGVLVGKRERKRPLGRRSIDGIIFKQILK
jgi:proteasome lid subunit RPN8/RPN11